MYYWVYWYTAVTLEDKGEKTLNSGPPWPIQEDPVLQTTCILNVTLKYHLFFILIFYPPKNLQMAFYSRICKASNVGNMLCKFSRKLGVVY